MATRRLPVIQEPAGEDAEAAARPAWQWVLIGSGLLVTMWTPLAFVAMPLAQRFGGGSLPASLAAVTFALSGLAAGYLVGRFGLRARTKHVVLSGFLAAAEIWLLALMGGAISSLLVGVSVFLPLAVLGGGSSALGSWLFRRKKSGGSPPSKT
jgi:hypothetical protein